MAVAELYTVEVDLVMLRMMYQQPGSERDDVITGV